MSNFTSRARVVRSISAPSLRWFAAAFLIAPGAAAAAPAAIPDDPSPDCWRAAFQSFQAGGHFTPAVTLQAAPGASTLAIDYRVRLAPVRMGDVTVRSVPVAAITPIRGRAWLYYYGASGARRCVIPSARFADPAFIDVWNYAPLHLHLNGQDRFRYNVSSEIDYTSVNPVSVPPRAPYGGVGCDQSNAHTHGLLVRPNAPKNPATGTFGDFVLTTATPARPSVDACKPASGSQPEDGHAHGAGAVPLMRHRIAIPPTPAGEQADWLRHSPGAPSLHPTGLYFFHPHPHGYSAMQMSGATSNMITIGDPPKAAASAPAQNLRHILLRDMQAKPAAGAPKTYDFSADTDPGFCADAADSLAVNRGYCQNGQAGRWFFTVNGQLFPLIDDIRGGEQEVWRIVNASPTVSYRLSVGRIDAAGKPIESEKLDLQLLTVDGASAEMVGAERHKFPRNILLMPGARVEFAINAPKGGGEYQLFSDTVLTGGDTWKPVALARVRWPATTPEAAKVEQAVAQEQTSGGKEMARRYENFVRLDVRGPDLSKPTKPNPRPYPAITPACRDLTDRKQERIIHFVKNPKPKTAVAGKDLFGLIVGFRPAGEIDASRAEYFRHRRGDGPDVQTQFASFAEVQKFNADPQAYTPAFGQPEDASSVCSVLQKDETYSEVWVIENWTNEIHNFHLHQAKFRIYGSAAPAYQNLPCKAAGPGACNDTDRLLNAFYEDTSQAAHDTVPVPRGVGDGDSCDGTIGAKGCNPGRIAIEVRFGRREMIGQRGHGDFVFHCHILEHEDRGMMGLIRVIDPAVYRAAKTASSEPAAHRH